MLFPANVVTHLLHRDKMWALTLDIGLAMVLVLAVVLLYIFYYADADLVLLYKDRFGKRPGECGDCVWCGDWEGCGECEVCGVW